MHAPPKRSPGCSYISLCLQCWTLSLVGSHSGVFLDFRTYDSVKLPERKMPSVSQGMQISLLFQLRHSPIFSQSIITKFTYSGTSINCVIKRMKVEWNQRQPSAKANVSLKVQRAVVIHSTILEHLNTSIRRNTSLPYPSKESSYTLWGFFPPFFIWCIYGAQNCTYYVV